MVRLQRFGRVLALTALLGAVLVIGLPATASAHGGIDDEAVTATNYRSVVVALDPRAAGLDARMVDAGQRIEITNHTGGEVIVAGYEGEPYLRLVGGEVWVNTRSPAAYLNVDATGTAAVPDTADASAPPEWERIGTGDRAAWHDHRTHWMGAGDHPLVETDPDTEQLLYPWTVPVQAGGVAVEVQGELRWVPGPDPLPWSVGIVVVAVGVALLGLTRWWRPAAVVAGTALLVVTVAATVDAWLASPAGLGDKIMALTLPGLGWLLVGGSLVLLGQRPTEAPMVLAGGAAGLGMLFGWTSRAYFSSSQLPVASSADLVRLLVAAALALGVGLTGLGALAWWRQGASGARRSFLEPTADGPPVAS
ncbi:MAG: hypothetical protein MUF83_10075 [Acidimicrobiales bacterium]|jgi:hypothetical protein|nr:hypothetical protein [Acidimicrobiales bacterium]